MGAKLNPELQEIRGSEDICCITKKSCTNVYYYTKKILNTSHFKGRTSLVYVLPIVACAAMIEANLYPPSLLKVLFFGVKSVRFSCSMEAYLIGTPV